MKSQSSQARGPPLQASSAWQSVQEVARRSWWPSNDFQELVQTPRDAIRSGPPALYIPFDGRYRMCRLVGCFWISEALRCSL